MVETAVAGDRYFQVLGNVTMSRLLMYVYLEYPAGAANFAFNQDRVILNFGPYRNQRVYYDVQSPTAIPFPTAGNGIPAAYIGKTSLQLWTQYGVAIGGALAPLNAITPKEITGLVGPAT
jgi:hypothetical protein